ncbi:hypothetical protein SAMN00120144_2338 [Hymenobacter roseosalivarius DSM 11622]|uniref:Uncharacterized protein n=1 Tax=Hymenobacter roseosalivarius DSM 11622 TaxID=645990 RepID=A0A1W1VM04_9BACT|nr:hypothetical protein SAMN00120144_2338 [Hymenobacter roseosalivarius DSM 11622]
MAGFRRGPIAKTGVGGILRKQVLQFEKLRC